MTNLNSIAKSYLLDKGYPMHWFLVALKQACECTEDLAKHTIDIIKTVVLEVDANGYACLPHDFSSEVRVGGGFCHETVRLQPGILNYADAYKVTVQPSYAYNLDDGWYSGWYSWYGGEAITGPIHKYRFEYQLLSGNKRIRVSGCFANHKIPLDYIPTFGKCDNVTLVPDEAKETIKDWIHWKIPRYERGKSLAANAEDERIYKHSLYKLRAFSNKLTPERLMQIRAESIWRGNK